MVPGLATQPARGALLFSCNGRGAHLYGEPDHDSRVMAAATGPLPMAGFFCNGEIGPIGNTNFLHGFTASIGIFQEKE
jgi:small ligand-binding sensory domain FIST